MNLRIVGRSQECPPIVCWGGDTVEPKYFLPSGFAHFQFGAVRGEMSAAPVKGEALRFHGISTRDLRTHLVRADISERDN